MSPRELDARAQALRCQDQPGEDVVISRIAGEQWAPSDVVEICTDDDGVGVDRRRRPPPRRDQRLGDGTDDAAVLLEPVGIVIPPEKRIGFSGQLRQFAIDTA